MSESAITGEESSGGPGPFEDRPRSVLASANIPTLLMVLVQMTRDRRCLKDPYRQTRNHGLGDNPTGGLDQADIREAAYQAILACKGGRPLAVPSPSCQLLVDMLSVALGETLPAARERARSHIRVVTIAGGMFDRPRVAGLPEKARRAAADRVPDPARLAAPDEYAALMEQIIDNPMHRGAVLRLDGAVRLVPR